MKKLYLLLAAATLMLASCMQENLTPDRPADGQVTIKAVAADTKTLLNGTDVVWENDDQIKVVVHDDYLYAYDFDAKTVNDATADFVGTIEQSEYDAAYAVYPASAVNVNNTKWVTHTLAETQTGVVTSGMNLSSALLDAEALKNGVATATFKNALTLLQVTVPSGVASVALTSSMDDNGLVGTVSFTMNADGALVLSSRATQRRTVTLSTGSELEAGTYSLLVYPGNYSSLTLTMTGTDGAVYESTISATFVAGEYRPINLTEIFKMETEEEMFISPAGGECEVKIASVADYTYVVSITDNWLSYTIPTKGDFHQDVITFSAGENTTGADRTANVTITWGEGEDQTRSFTITQKSVFMDFVNDENGDPIQWEESFGVYSTEADASAETNPVKTFTNVFTIGLSDDFSKGAYKVNGIFAYNNSYSGKTGGVYYADYADGILTVYKETAETQSYNFTDKEVNLTYDSANKTFSASSAIGFGYKFDNADLRNGGFIGGYAAAVKAVDEPETPGEGGEEGGVDAASLAGNYSEEYATFMSSGSGTMTITVLGNDISVSMCNGSLTCSATLSSDGKTLTVNSDGVGYQGNINDPFSGNMVLNISNVEGKIKLTLSTSTNLWGMSFLTSYTATKN